MTEFVPLAELKRPSDDFVPLDSLRAQSYAKVLDPLKEFAVGVARAPGNLFGLAGTVEQMPWYREQLRANLRAPVGLVSSAELNAGLPNFRDSMPQKAGEIFAGGLLFGPTNRALRVGEAIGQTAGGLLGHTFAGTPGEIAGSVFGGTPVRGLLSIAGPGAPQRLASQTLRESSSDPLASFDRGLLGMRTAQGQGTQLSAGQAIPELAGLESTLYAARPASMRPFYDTQNVSAANTADRAATALTGLGNKTAVGADDLTATGREGATNAIRQTEKIRTVEAGKAGFAKADQSFVPAQNVERLVDELRTAASAPRNAGPVAAELNSLADSLVGLVPKAESRAMAPNVAVKDEGVSLAALDTQRKIYSGRIDLPPFAAGAIEKNVAKEVIPYLRKIDDILQSNPAFAAGKAKFEELTPMVDALGGKSGSLSRMADSTIESFSNSVLGMSSDKRQQAARTMMMLPNSRNAVPAVMRNLINDAMDKAGNAQHAFGARMAQDMQGGMPSRLDMPDAVTGESYLALRDFATALPNGQQKWATFEKVLDTLALMRQPNLGSNTVDKAGMQATLAGTTERPFTSQAGVTGAGLAAGGAAGAFIGNTLAPGIGAAYGGPAGAAAGALIANKLEGLRQAANVRVNSQAFADLFTSPEALAKLRPLLMMNPGSERAQRLVRNVFQAGASVGREGGDGPTD
jgi:hypothetical protein